MSRSLHCCTTIVVQQTHGIHYYTGYIYGYVRNNIVAANKQNRNQFERSNNVSNNVWSGYGASIADRCRYCESERDSGRKKERHENVKNIKYNNIRDMCVAKKKKKKKKQQKYSQDVMYYIGCRQRHPIRERERYILKILWHFSARQRYALPTRTRNSYMAYIFCCRFIFHVSFSHGILYVHCT